VVASKETVPIGTGDTGKEPEMKRVLTTTAMALMLAASGVYGQTTAANERNLSPWSPLVYEWIGATPKIELRKAPAAPAAVKVTEDAKAADKAAGSVGQAPAQSTAQARAAAADRNAAAPATN
jgi:hypothetical protein